MKKLFILLAAATALTLASCTPKAPDEVPTADETEPEAEVTENAENEEEDEAEDEEVEVDYLSDLSTDRFDGYNFRILVRKGQVNDQAPLEDSDDLVVGATFRRNKIVEDMYGITIEALESSDSNYDTSAMNTILAGDDAYDIIFSHCRAAFTYAVQGAALNINEIPEIHLDKPWWAKDISDSCDINGNLYVLSGDISSKPLGAAMCLYFNKRIFDELGFDYPYDMVRDGEWTFDNFSYMVRKAGRDLNGDGVMKSEDDQFGLIAGQWEEPINILYAAGQKIYDKNEDGELELTLYSNKTVAVYDAFFSLMNNEACIMSSAGRGYASGDAWGNGRQMFQGAELQHAAIYRNMDDDFGILPYPKFDEEDDYHTASNGGTVMMIVPITVPDTHRTGAITEALCAIGSRDVIPAFYDVSLKTKYARDTDSEEMIDLIKDSIIFDMGYLAGGTFQSCGYDLAQMETPNFSSYYQARESKAKDALKSFCEAYGGTGEDE